MWWLLLFPWAGFCLIALGLARSALLADERLEIDVSRGNTKKGQMPS